MEWSWKQKLAILLGIFILVAPLVAISGWTLQKVQGIVDEGVAEWKAKRKENPSEPLPEWVLTWQERIGRVYDLTIRPEEAAAAYEKAERLYAWARRYRDVARVMFARAKVYDDVATYDSKEKAWKTFFLVGKRYRKYLTNEERAYVEKALQRLYKYRDQRLLR